MEMNKTILRERLEYETHEAYVERTVAEIAKRLIDIEQDLRVMRRQEAGRFLPAEERIAVEEVEETRNLFRKDNLAVGFHVEVEEVGETRNLCRNPGVGFCPDHYVAGVGIVEPGDGVCVVEPEHADEFDPPEFLENEDDTLAANAGSNE